MIEIRLIIVKKTYWRTYNMPTQNKNPIPIKNIFYMLCYAWNVLEISHDIKVGEEDIDDSYNLLARVFTFGISKVIRSGFHRSYVEKEEELSTLRGKINIQQSINGMTMQQKKLVCNYDEYSTNDIFNQILKYTMDSIIYDNSVDKNTRRELKKLSVFFDGIDSKPPTKENRIKLVFNRNNATYRLLINVAVMLYEGKLPNEESTNKLFEDFFREEQMPKVFELFILNFYAMKLSKETYKVHAPKINWHFKDNAQVLLSDLFDEVVTEGEDRRTDIVVENKEKHYQIIMDAKYYQNMLVKAYMSEEENSIRTSHINQIRGYLTDSDFQGKKIGALIYPKVTAAANQARPYDDFTIIIKTLNLADDWQNIEKDMLKLVKACEVALDRI